MNSKEFKSRVITLTPRIYPMVARMLQSEEDARDAVQEVMLKLWKNRKSLANHPNIAGYAFLTARNYCLDNIKRTNQPGSNSTGYEIYYIEGEEQSDYDQKESSQIIIEIIESLPEKQKEVVMLRDIDGLEFGEIIALTGERVENLRVNLSRGRKRIALKLTEIYNYEYRTGQ